MKTSIVVVFIVVFLLFVFCQKDNPMGTVQKIVEQELKKKGLSFEGPDSECTYKLNLQGHKVTLSIQNISRDFERDKDTSAISRFVDNALSGFSTPSWENVTKFIRFSLEAANSQFGDAIRDSVTPNISKVLVYTDSNESRITWITPYELTKWGTTKDSAYKIANENMDRLISSISPEIQDIHGMKLAIIPLPSQAFKASVIIAPKFKEFITTKINWPVYSVIPCRDYIYVFSEKDKGLLNRIGKVVQDEYRKSGYPLTTEVLSISDKGIIPIGEFPK